MFYPTFLSPFLAHFLFAIFRRDRAIGRSFRRRRNLFSFRFMRYFMRVTTIEEQGELLRGWGLKSGFEMSPFS